MLAYVAAKREACWAWARWGTPGTFPFGHQPNGNESSPRGSLDPRQALMDLRLHSPAPQSADTTRYPRSLLEERVGDRVATAGQTVSTLGKRPCIPRTLVRSYSAPCPMTSLVRVDGCAGQTKLKSTC